MENSVGDINAKTDSGKTLLMVAAKEGNRNTLETLIKTGVDVNAVNSEGKTALMLAVEYKRNTVKLHR